MIWISVEDSLPECRYGIYLCCEGDQNIFIGALYQNSSNGILYWENFETGDLVKVTHWMQLPEPPKEQKAREVINETVEDCLYDYE